MEIKGTREDKLSSIKSRIKGNSKEYPERISNVSEEEMQFLQIDNTRQLLNIAKTFLVVFILAPVIIYGLYALYLYKY